MGEPRTFYVVACGRCEPPLPMPFYDFDERDRWAAEHATTGHDEFTWWTEGDAHGLRRLVDVLGDPDTHDPECYCPECWLSIVESSDG
jgi:hypothetical protein